MSLQPAGQGDVWARFTADPRRSERAEVRASDADRDVVAEVLAGAYAEGRLDDVEYQERLGKAMAVKRLGEVRPLLDDLVIDGSRRGASTVSREQDAPRRGLDFRSASLRSWLGLAILFNLIWLMTSLGNGELNYYWPMWPMLGTGIPVIMAMIFGGERDKRDGSDGEGHRRQVGR